MTTEMAAKLLDRIHNDNALLRATSLKTGADNRTVMWNDLKLHMTLVTPRYSHRPHPYTRRLLVTLSWGDESLQIGHFTDLDGDLFKAWYDVYDNIKDIERSRREARQRKLISQLSSIVDNL